MIQVITTPKTITFKTNHITEEEMKAKYSNISSWLSDQNGIIEVTVLEENNTMKKIYNLSLLSVDKPKFDDRICDFKVVAESLEEAIAKGEEAFAKGCKINKTTFIKYYGEITEFCECEVEGVFLPDYIK